MLFFLLPCVYAYVGMCFVRTIDQLIDHCDASTRWEWDRHVDRLRDRDRGKKNRNNIPPINWGRPATGSSVFGWNMSNFCKLTELDFTVWLPDYRVKILYEKYQWCDVTRVQQVWLPDPSLPLTLFPAFSWKSLCQPEDITSQVKTPTGASGYKTKIIAGALLECMSILSCCLTLLDIGKINSDL